MHHPLFDILPAEREDLRSLPPGRAIAAAAATRDGVLTREQLLAIGLGSSAIGRRVENELLFPRFAGVYAVGRLDLPLRGRLRAALLHIGRSAALSHHTAATQHDLLAGRARIAITTTGTGRRPPRSSGIELHYTARWLRGEVEWVGGLPCTSVARTIAGLAGRPDARELARAWNAADRLGLLDVGSLEQQLGRRFTGCALVQARLDDHEEAPPTESEMEDLFHELCARHGLPRPTCQWPLRVGDRTGRVDFVFPGRVAVELDSRRWHEAKEAQDADREKDMALREAGYEPHRYGWKQVVTQGPRVARLVAAAIAARAPSR